MKRLRTLILFFVIMTLAGMLGRGLFYVVYRDLIAGNGETGFLPMLWYGLQLDIAVAGYVTLLPTLIMIVAEWWNGKILLWTWRVWQWIAVAAMTIAFVANIALYKYWGFPLDSTPLFFLENSPGEFIACLSVWQMVLGPIGIAVLIAVFYVISDRSLHPERVFIHRHDRINTGKSIRLTLAYIIFIGILIICIRGGFGVSVNNVGKVYFSTNNRLNHAAVNPVFSFVASVTSDEDFSKKYRFMDDKEAERLFAGLVYTAQRETADSILTPEFHKAVAEGKSGKGEGVRVVIVVLESFSRYIMSDGGEGIKGVVPNLERLASEGVYFTNFYASSFRTDRGVMSILSGFPAQPTMSLMKFPHKTNNLYSIARSLKREGFSTQYVYGGDANFTNCRSYLMSTGVEDVIAQEDYDKSIPRGKWGVDDEYLFDRALKEADKDKEDENVLRIIQTSSSHEPYEVPWHKLSVPQLNAFNYSDNCIGQFVDRMKKRSDWNRTLIVFCPDHLGCYPENIDNFKLYRYRIPLIFAGGAIAKPRTVDTIGSQQDIAATLLALLGIDHREFTYSKDMFDARAPHFAYFAVPDAMGMVTRDGEVIYDNSSRKVVLTGREGRRNLPLVKAYLQKLYDDIAKR